MEKNLVLKLQDSLLEGMHIPGRQYTIIARCLDAKNSQNLPYFMDLSSHERFISPLKVACLENDINKAGQIVLESEIIRDIKDNICIRLATAKELCEYARLNELGIIISVEYGTVQKLSYEQRIFNRNLMWSFPKNSKSLDNYVLKI